MATSRKVSVPGAADSDPTPPVPLKKSPKKKAAPAVVDPALPADEAALPPKIVEAIETATHMSVAKAMELDERGELPHRVLTPDGWFVPRDKEAAG